MATPDLTTTEREELVKWMRSGFRQYAAQCESWRGEQRRVRVQIFKYGNEFARILRGEIEMSEDDDPQALRTDLYGLRAAGCPAAGIVKLMLACTSDHSVTIPGLLFGPEFLREHLIWDNLGFADEPGPGVKIGEIVSSRLLYIPVFMRARISKRAQAARARYHLGLFYLLLKHFGYDHVTLAQILRTMRDVRRRVPPLVEHLKTRGKLKFNAGALQRKVHRFLNSDPRKKLDLKQEISDFAGLTKTAVTSSASPSNPDEPVTFTATVTAAKKWGPLPNGEQVSFYDNSKFLASAKLSNGAAVYTTSTLSVGSHVISASYPGNNTFARSSGTRIQVVNHYATSTRLKSSRNPSTKVQAVTLTATVKSAAPGDATGKVTFKNGRKFLGISRLTAGRAKLATAKLPAGTLTITATYGGDAQSAKSSGTTTQVVSH